MSKDLKESEYDSSKVTEHGVPLYIHERLCKQARDTVTVNAGKPKNQLNVGSRSIFLYDENTSPYESRINDINDLTQKEADEFIKNVNKYFEKFLSQKTKEEIPPYIINNLSEAAKKKIFNSEDKPVYRSVLTNDTTSLFLWDSAGHSNATYYYDEFSLEKADEFVEKVNSYFENLNNKKKEIVQEEKIQEEEDKKLSKQENKEEKIEDSTVTVATTNTNTNKLKEIIVSDSVEVYKRISVSKISKLVQDILIQIISAAAPKNKKQVHSQLESFFKSEKGKALIQLVSGASLPFVLSHIPEKYREYISVASDELRIQGEAQIALEIIDSFSGFMKTKIIEDLISSGEFVRVDVSSRKKENNLDSEEIESQQSSSILLQGAL